MFVLVITEGTIYVVLADEIPANPSESTSRRNHDVRSMSSVRDTGDENGTRSVSRHGEENRHE